MQKKYGGAKGVSNDITLWRLRVACSISKVTCMHVRASHTPTCPSTRTNARAYAHTQICNTYCFSTATMIRKSISLLRFTYIVCLVIIPHSFSVETNIRLSSQEIEFPSRDPKLYYHLRNTEPLGPILK
jgi:hypothetical protein